MVVTLTGLYVGNDKDLLQPSLVWRCWQTMASSILPVALLGGWRHLHHSVTFSSRRAPLWPVTCKNPNLTSLYIDLLPRLQWIFISHISPLIRMTFLHPRGSVVFLLWLGRGGKPFGNRFNLCWYHCTSEYVGLLWARLAVPLCFCSNVSFYWDRIAPWLRIFLTSWSCILFKRAILRSGKWLTFTVALARGLG